jgi:hypothetical protein
MAVDGSFAVDDRSESMRMFRAGAVQFLVNCALYVEGLDEPSVSCVAISRPTKSRLFYTQMIGRALRPSTSTGKTDALILDFTGQSGRHRLVGPVDVLAGELVDDRTRRKAEAALADESDVVDVLDAASGFKARGVKYKAHRVEMLWGQERDRFRRRLRERRAAGLCSRCPAQARPGKGECQECADKSYQPKPAKAKVDADYKSEVLSLVRQAGVAPVARRMGRGKSTVGNVVLGKKGVGREKLDALRNAAVQLLEARAVVGGMRSLAAWGRATWAQAWADAIRIEAARVAADRRREYGREWERARSEERAQKGQCLECESPSVPGLRKCQRHRILKPTETRCCVVCGDAFTVPVGMLTLTCKAKCRNARESWRSDMKETKRRNPSWPAWKLAMWDARHGSIDGPTSYATGLGYEG